ncbi:MAG: murein biosynthesis integral membrane protein MurJ, partial [Acidimicrobiia bacterium]|nr:murein biosynthesis integral membrane protein MurJ [Acidimicrobiia bacterium]
EYFVAFLIPDFLFYLLAGAYMAITLIPILSRRFAAGDEEDAWRAFWAVARPLAIGSTILVVVAMPLVEPVLRLVEPGFTDDQVANAARLTRIVLPAQVFFILGQLLTSVQFARERFLVPTLGPILYNVGIIVGGLLGALGGEATPDGFAWGALGGAIVGTFALQAWGAWRAGLRFPTGSIRRHPAVKRYFALAIPLMLGQSLVVLDEQLGRTFGSLVEDGGISWLTFGRQTMLVPVGVIAQAAGVATYPFLARLVAEGRHRDMARAVTRALRWVVTFSLAAVAGMMALAIPIVRVLYEHGEFDAMDTVATAGTVVFFSLGIPLWGMQQLLARGFYAREEMWVPVVIGTAATVAAVPIYWGLHEAIGVDGLALASTLGVALYTTALAVVWYGRTGWEHARPVAVSALTNLPVAVLAGLAGWGVSEYLLDALAPAGFTTSFVAAAAGGAVVLGVALAPPRVRAQLRRG